MSSKLDEIKNAVAAVGEVDPWHTSVSWDDQDIITAVMRVGDFDLGTTANDAEENILTLLGNSRDYLKALLSVVYAAVEWDRYRIEFQVIGGTDNAFDAEEKLVEALEALTGD